MGVTRTDLCTLCTFSHTHTHRSIGICRIFTEMCESFLYYLTSHPNSEMGDLRVLDWLLDCVAHPDYEVCLFVCLKTISLSPYLHPSLPPSLPHSLKVAEITLNLWYRLSEELMKIDCRETTELFRPFINKLIAHLCVHCRLDEDTNQVGVAFYLWVWFLI